MGLPTQFMGLDLDRRGMPWTKFNKTPQDDSYSLDHDTRGMPFVYQLEVIPQDAAVITITARPSEVHVHARRFPNKRQEMIGETQIKHIVPLFESQYPAYLP